MHKIRNRNYLKQYAYYFIKIYRNKTKNYHIIKIINKCSF